MSNLRIVQIADSVLFASGATQSPDIVAYLELSAAMTPDELKTILRNLDVSQVKFGEMLGHNGRTGQYWCSVSVPGSVEILARLLAARPELLALVQDMANERDAAARKLARKGGK